jgi:hypothetical protein
MKVGTFFWICVPLLIVGCNRPQPHETVSTPAPANTGQDSDHPAGVAPLGGYNPTETGAPPAPSPPGLSVTDMTVADSIRQMLKGQPQVPEEGNKVEATVDRGVVTLRGTVPTQNTHDELLDRIRKLPGVDRVNDELRVDLR